MKTTLWKKLTLSVFSFSFLCSININSTPPKTQVLSKKTTVEPYSLCEECKVRYCNNGAVEYRTDNVSFYYSGSKAGVTITVHRNYDGRQTRTQHCIRRKYL